MIVVLLHGPGLLQLLDLLSFLGVETSHKQRLEKRSVKKVFKKILGGVIKGLFFRFLWGEERALRLGTVLTGP